MVRASALSKSHIDEVPTNHVAFSIDRALTIQDRVQCDCVTTNPTLGPSPRAREGEAFLPSLFAGEAERSVLLVRDQITDRHDSVDSRSNARVYYG